MYYDDEFDSIIAEWVEKVPEKKRSRAMRALILSAAVGEAGGAGEVHPAEPQRAERSAELVVETEENQAREMNFLSFEPD